MSTEPRCSSIFGIIFLFARDVFPKIFTFCKFTFESFFPCKITIKIVLQNTCSFCSKKCFTVLSRLCSFSTDEYFCGIITKINVRQTQLCNLSYSHSACYCNIENSSNLERQYIENSDYEIPCERLFSNLVNLW